MKKRALTILMTLALFMALLPAALAAGTGDGYTPYNLKWLEGGKLSFDVEKNVDRSSYYLYLYDAAGEMVGIEQTSGKPTTANADGSYTWVVDLGKEMTKPGIYRAVVGLYQMEALAMGAIQGDLLGQKVTSPDYTFGGGASAAGSITLDAPTNLRWVVDGDTVSVAWDPGANMTDEDSYEVSVSNTSTGWGNMVAPTKDTFRVIVFSQFSSTHLPGAPATSDGKYTFTVKPVSGDATKRLSREEGTPCTTAYLYPDGKIVNADGSTTAPPPTTPVGVPAAKSASKVLFDGAAKSFDAYTINQNNYFKLRDIALLFSGTSKQFEVTWNAEKGAIELLRDKPYTPVGGEMAPAAGATNLTATPNAAKIYLDGKEISLTAYTIGGNNYFKLRDLGEVFNFAVEWDGGSNTIVLRSDRGYSADQQVSPAILGLSGAEYKFQDGKRTITIDGTAVYAVGFIGMDLGFYFTAEDVKAQTTPNVFSATDADGQSVTLTLDGDTLTYKIREWEGVATQVSP